jgi:hypothetical protein
MFGGGWTWVFFYLFIFRPNLFPSRPVYDINLTNCRQLP